jgi:hypothetical protein
MRLTRRLSTTKSRTCRSCSIVGPYEIALEGILGARKDVKAWIIRAAGQRSTARPLIAVRTSPPGVDDSLRQAGQLSLFLAGALDRRRSMSVVQ